MEVMQKVSEISLFNDIKEYSEKLGYDVILFKSKMPKIVKVDDEFKTKYRYLHYIQVFTNEHMKLSIYYDEHTYIGNNINYKYYELYYIGDVERFFTSEEDEKLLLDKVKQLLKD